MNRAAFVVVMLGFGVGGAAFAADPPANRVPPPPQTQGQLNSMAAKEPAKAEQMKPLSSAAQATPRKKVSQQAAAESKPKQKQTDSEKKPQDR